MSGALSDLAVVTLLDDALQFDAGAEHRHLIALERFFWPVIRTQTGVSEDVLESRWKETRERAAEERESRALLRALQKAVCGLRGDEVGRVGRVRAQLEADVQSASKTTGTGAIATLRTVSAETGDQHAYLARFMGNEFVGLPQRTLPKLDRLTRGLRGLILVGGGPNVGKTVLGVQLGVDCVLADPDVCLVIVSLELDRRELETRELCRSAKMSWSDVVLGTKPGQMVDGAPTYTHDELDRLKSAWDEREEWGARTIILDHENFFNPSGNDVLTVVESLKKSTGTKRAIVVFDYLQLMDIEDDAQRHLRSELAEDKWRIEQMKRLRDAPAVDALIVITEARKPANDSSSSWGGRLDDLMGAARIAYRADMVFLLVPLSDTQLEELASVTAKYPGLEKEELRDSLAADGVSLLRLSIVKGRDGVRRGHIDLTFHYEQTRFRQGHL